jgi:hypothetical protein
MRSPGTLRALFRYPVKSMQGGPIAEGLVTARGLAGDRAWAVIHRDTGRIGSGKRPRLWRALLALRAAYEGTGVRITLPGGQSVHSDDPAADEVLSGHIGQPVRLTSQVPATPELERAEPEQVLRDGLDADVAHHTGPLGGGAVLGADRCQGTFHDFAPIHLITTATLDRIAASSARGAIEAERYRPNLVIETTGPGFDESDWAGRHLHVGASLILEIVGQTPRCAIPTLPHGDLPPDPEALRVVAAHNRVVPMAGFPAMPCAGAYAVVRAEGTVRPGDRVWLR